ncbi:MAG: hypothetical protein HY074_01665 [Deltaproteobacteria bacterium]|nr:hypothetical protein [Deltaproteobacteria bacterium]
MKSLWLKSGAVASTALWSFAALAQSSSATTSANPALSGTSTASSATSAAAKAAPLPITINSLNIFYGPPVTSPGQHSSADSAINQDPNTSTTLQPMFIRNQLSATYKLDAKTSITPVLDFDLIMADPSSDAKKEGFHWRDNFVKFSRSGLMEKSMGANKFSLDGDIRLYAPTSAASRANLTIGETRVSLFPSMAIGKSKWSFSAVLFGKYWIQPEDMSTAKKIPVDPSNPNSATTDGGQSPLTRLELYAGPQINYEFSPKVTAFLLFEADNNWNTHGMPASAATGYSNYDFEPGVNLTLHNRLSLTPALNWYTNQRLSTTSMILTAAIKLL